MTQQPISPVEAAFQTVRASEAPLADRLAVVAEAARVHRPEYTAAVEAFVARLRAVHAGSEAPQVGDMMPGFTLPDDSGHLVSLDELLERGPVIVAFHRGHWCPYCRLNMIGLAEIEGKVAPAQIVAISTETQRYTRILKAGSGAMFPVLTDMDAAYTMSLNLAVWADTELSRAIAKAGWDIPLYQGGGDWVMPIPAVFVLNQQGKIVGRHVDPDYRQRMDLEELLSCVDMVRD